MMALSMSSPRSASIWLGRRTSTEMVAGVCAFWACLWVEACARRARPRAASGALAAIDIRESSMAAVAFWRRPRSTFPGTKALAGTRMSSEWGAYAVEPRAESSFSASSRKSRFFPFALSAVSRLASTAISLSTEILWSASSNIVRRSGSPIFPLRTMSTGMRLLFSRSANVCWSSFSRAGESLRYAFMPGATLRSSKFLPNCNINLPLRSITPYRRLPRLNPFFGFSKRMPSP